ncbi:MAG: DUF4845 domain-containing protein [Gammaproteobacteria bacterium]
MNRQTGMTIWGYSLVLLIIGFITLGVLKLAPIYIEHLEVLSSMNSLKSESGIDKKDKRDIKELLLRRLRINNVDSVTGKNIKITKEKRKTVVHVAYEIREPFLVNIDFVVAFDESVSL